MEENKLFEFFRKRGRTFSIILCLALCTAIGCSYFSSKRGLLKKKYMRTDLVTLEKIFDKLKQGELLKEENIENVTLAFRRNPCYAQKYGHLFGLALLASHRNAEAMHYLSTSSNGSIEKLAFFNKITLLIEDHDYKQALNSAKELNYQLEGDDSYQALYAYNLVRTLFLAKEVGEPLVAQTTFEKLRAHKFWPHMNALFHQSNLGINEYVSH